MKPELDADIGDLVFQHCNVAERKPPVDSVHDSSEDLPDDQIVIDVHPFKFSFSSMLSPIGPPFGENRVDPDWEPPQCSSGIATLENLSQWEGGCGGFSFRQAMSVGTVFGAGIKTIRVVRYIPPPEKPSVSAKEMIRSVWRGKFVESPQCMQLWSEWTYWRLDAILEFQDGTQGRLVTDGWHVAVQTRTGKVLYLRLEPK